MGTCQGTVVLLLVSTSAESVTSLAITRLAGDVCLSKPASRQHGSVCVCRLTQELELKQHELELVNQRRAGSNSAQLAAAVEASKSSLEEVATALRDARQRQAACVQEAKVLPLPLACGWASDNTHHQLPCCTCCDMAELLPVTLAALHAHKVSTNSPTPSLRTAGHIQALSDTPSQTTWKSKLALTEHDHLTHASQLHGSLASPAACAGAAEPDQQL